MDEYQPYRGPETLLREQTCQIGTSPTYKNPETFIKWDKMVATDFVYRKWLETTLTLAGAPDFHIKNVTEVYIGTEPSTATVVKIHFTGREDQNCEINTTDQGADSNSILVQYFRCTSADGVITEY
uniref:Protein polybromo-1 n=1 Tax=Lygus hesperus TaxID=30085 RepID=A0A0A9WQF3_LYGHE